MAPAGLPATSRRPVARSEKAAIARDENADIARSAKSAMDRSEKYASTRNERAATGRNEDADIACNMIAGNQKKTASARDGPTDRGQPRQQCAGPRGSAPPAATCLQAGLAARLVG